MSSPEASPRRKREYITSFSNASQEEAEILLGFQLDKFYYSQTPLDEFMTTTAPEELKKKCFERLVDCILSEGFPEPSISPLNEAAVTDNVALILWTMLSYFIRVNNRGDLRLTREKQLITEDEQFGGNMEFIITQSIHVRRTRYVLVVEAKRHNLAKGLVQLLLELHSMCKKNDDGKMVFGFLTTGINWQLVTFDCQTWKLSCPSTLLIGEMHKNETKWLKENTQILDVIFSILSSL